MRTNTAKKPTEKTYEGAAIRKISPEMELRRSVMACLLFEDNFYENGIDHALRIRDLVKTVSSPLVAQIARDAKIKQHLRHVPLLLAREIARKSDFKGRQMGDLIYDLIQRPDDITEILAMLWANGKCSVPEQFKRGISRAFHKFDEYQFGKYNTDRAVKLRDALFICRPKAKNPAKVELFKKIADNTLATPDTWEANLSRGKNKKTDYEKSQEWERLLSEKKLGGMAFLRNLRNFQDCGVDNTLVKKYFETANFNKVLPFRFIAAANHAPLLEPEIETAMLKSLTGQPKLKGHTVVLVDNSISMYGPKISQKSEIDRIDAACALAILIAGIAEDATVIAFSEKPTIIPKGRKGFALRDAIKATSVGGTYTETALKEAKKHNPDRIIVITDGQSHETVSGPGIKRGYFLNIASYKNGVGYGQWTNIDGWSEAVIDYIRELESVDADY